MVPDAGSLLEHVQSPPVEKLLGEYLPTLHRFPLSKEVFEEIRNAVALRNLVAHKGSTDVDPTRLRAMLQTVRSVLASARLLP